ncbi:N-formylglutamate amidohydrolase [Cognatishimia activa]|uniref:Putative N-formylglutamate amidohydrolase n=1 Tax=Cognatishimia activa TaxID=1715691 RepID=A0A0P1IRA2_9RHOB|nr:N-formylglutamate amidohydrolase [Cognatishimia activa]CUJ07182.1 putative N-formylglutamate amidohydrolase [Cognatishimia activa]CUK25983.1 putative N-formylglutamate amidohydrolase [Cognatishimia activa]
MTQNFYQIHGETRASRWVITVDHASNRVPEEVNGGDLGLAPADMQRHIAYDIGALGVALSLGELMDAPVVASDFSRLVIDPNRGEVDPTLIMRLYDGTLIPANAEIDVKEEQRRLETYYKPYNDAIERVASQRDDPIIVAMHSFSPRLNGKAPRPWEVAILHAAHDPRNLGPHVIERLREENDLTVGDNEPYHGHLPGDAVDRLALQMGRLNTLIELRQDLIINAKEQHAWATRLAPILNDALARSGY